MGEFLTVELHNEYAKRMEEEHTRQNHRISNLEKAVEENGKLLITVERIANSVETMQKDLGKQGEKVDELYSRDGAKWRKVTEYVALAIIGAGLGFLLAQIGF